MYILMTNLCKFQILSSAILKFLVACVSMCICSTGGYVYM